MAVTTSRKANVIQINTSAVKGEPGTGYEGPDGKGDFECGNCEYFDSDSVSCGQKDMMKLSKRPKLKDGRVVVHPDGCCEYVSRMADDYNADDD